LRGGKRAGDNKGADVMARMGETKHGREPRGVVDGGRSKKAFSIDEDWWVGGRKQKTEMRGLCEVFGANAQYGGGARTGNQNKNETKPKTVRMDESPASQRRGHGG